MTWWPEGEWDVWDPPVTEVLAGPSSTLLDPEDIPADLPVSRPAGFTADLEVRDRGGEQANHRGHGR